MFDLAQFNTYREDNRREVKRARAGLPDSIWDPYFDAVCLSYEEGLQKPDAAIFQRCLDKLHVQADECLYVGDGGSHELEAAEKAGMKAFQATWYLKENTAQPAKRKMEFEQFKTPLEILDFVP